ncbi:MAG: head-tail connector protein [Planctomycetes bacterium]|nr:head-tail connector protein [Planctomycetota bacterium]
MGDEKNAAARDPHVWDNSFQHRPNKRGPSAPASTEPIPEAEQYRKRWQQLDRLADDWKPLWREVNEYVLPWSGRFLHSSRDAREIRRGQNVHNSVTYNAIQTAAAGLHGGLTSPSRPWFEITHPDEDMMEITGVREWVHLVQNAQRQVLAQSNFYAAVQDLYYEALAYGQGVTLVEKDADGGVVRFRTLTCGEYRLGNGPDLRINTVYRRLTMTAPQMREAFGRERLPEAAARALADNRVDQRFRLVQAIQPWNFLEGGRSGAGRYESVYFMEEGSGDQVLAKRAYRTRPFVAVRWGSIGDDVYGYSPGQMALADIRQLQTQERAYVNAVNWIADPAWLVSDSLKDRLARGEIRPGAIVGANPQEAQHLFRPLMKPVFDFANIRLKIQDVEERIRQTFYNPLFLMVQAREGRMTATEVMQLVEEKAAVLGPVLERFQSELFDPVLERVFDIMDRDFAMIPPPPREIAGEGLKIEYISMLAQAQKQAGLSGMTHFLAVAGEIAARFPESALKINPDEAIDQLAFIDNVPPKVVRSDDEVSRLRKEAAVRDTARAEMEEADQAAGIVGKLADAGVAEL